jgi:hypothetical protein
MSSIRMFAISPALIALCLTFIVFAQDNKPVGHASKTSQVEVKSDRFSGNVTVTMKPQPLIDTAERKLTMDLWYELKRKDIEGSPVIPEEMASMSFESRATTASTAIELGDRELHFLIDGKQLSIGRTSSRSKPLPLVLSDGDEKGRKPYLSITSALSLSQIEQIAAGKQVEMRLGNIELPLSQSTLAAVREFAREFAAHAPTRSNRKGAKR